MYSNLGTNMAFFKLETIEQMALKRIEVCQGRHRPYRENVPSIEANIRMANAKGIPVSVHLPIYIPDDYPWDFLDAFYLDKDPVKAAQAFAILEDNLKRLQKYHIAYCVLHFAGVYEEIEAPETFKLRLKSACDRLEALAAAYGIKVLVEYFGSNVNFYDVADWIDCFKPYRSVGILLDTCHFYFAAKWRAFDFEANLRLLASHAEAFHIWTTYGEGVYQEAEGYVKFHHIVPNIEQTSANGWAFDTMRVLTVLAKTGKPMIIEASPHYLSYDYYINSIKGIQKFIHDL
ncbi:TIM barrel protein [Fusibacter paucivorans]|uniref:TIM barrel protein n=1 Tax=Fusibacter paucivorans TaxID=76009 RepID=A0ABS5PSE0_9FIRM|nr:TIM barrel protein [Fusibacter paucivorans]MBS7527286.1 TIM barrel protein [Fusibacter paucivorans]